MAEAAPKRRSKYRAVPTVVDGIRFSSKLEATRYADLRRLQSAGVISHLKLQPRLECVVNGARVCHYVADFSYRAADGGSVYEDTKGIMTDVFKLKLRLVEALYPGIVIKIVKARR